MSGHPRAVMLFAAGLGTRMGSLTRSRPKPLLPLAGRALIDHALDLTTGLEPVVINVHYRADDIRRHLDCRNGVAFSDETDRLLETGGGLKAALPLLGPGPVFTLNSDAGWSSGDALRLLAANWDPDRMDGLLLLVPPDRRHGHPGSGDFGMDENGALSRAGDWTYTGAQILKTDALHEISDEAFSLNLLWDAMLERGRLFGVEYPGNWADVGTPEGLRAAEIMLRASE